MKILTSITVIALLAANCGTTVTKEQSITAMDTSIGTSSNSDTAYNSGILFYRDSVDRKLNMLKTIKKDIEGSAEGGEAVIFLAGNDTLRMDFVFYGETGSSSYVFYLRQGSLVYYQARKTMYTAPIAADKPAKTDSVVIDKIILRNNEVTSWVQNGRFFTNDIFCLKEQDISELFIEVKKLLIQ